MLKQLFGSFRVVTDGIQVTMLTMELVSDSLPSGKQIVLDLTNTVALAEAKKNPITIKEGIEYKYALTMLSICILLTRRVSI